MTASSPDTAAAPVIDAGPLRVEALSDTVLRILHAPDGRSLPTHTSYALDPEATWAGPDVWQTEPTPAGTELRTRALTATVDAEGALQVTAGGVVVLDAEAPARDRVHHVVRLEDADRLLGLGDAPFQIDRRGHRVELWNTDAFRFGRGTTPLYKSFPFVLKQRAGVYVGLFYDNTFRAQIDLGASMPDRMVYDADDGVLDLYVIVGESPLDVVRQNAALTGRTPLMPKWALGYHQCRFSYMNEGEIRELAQQFRQRGIPCDTLYFDIHYMDGFRVFTWDRERFPDPPALLSDLKEDGFTSVVIIDPGVKSDDPEYDVYRQGVDLGAYIRAPDGSEVIGNVWPGPCAFPDYTRADVREWWGRLHRGLLADGVDGVWNDMNEPALFSTDHEDGSMDAEEDAGTLSTDVRHAMEGHGGSHAEAHNVYGMQMLRATYEGMRQLAPDRRPFTITRAAYAGAQRFGTGWTGDNASTWDHLRLAIEMCLSLGASGMPFVGSDVGGFVGKPEGELLARWTQIGAVTPLFRNHSAIDEPRQEPWLFGEEVEQVCREAIELRYRLLPVLYTALWQSATQGTPIMRALPLVHPTDQTIRRTDPLSFYVGDDLLAAPVVEQGQREREIYLPENEGGWYDFVSGEHLEGRQTIWTQTPLDRVPLYARAGSVIPLAPVRQHTHEPVGSLTLHVYPAPGRHTSWLYEDAGDGYDDHWLGRLDVEDDGQAVSLEVSVDGAYAPEWTSWTVVVHGLDSTPQRVEVNRQQAETEWDGHAATVTVPVGASVRVER